VVPGLGTTNLLLLLVLLLLLLPVSEFLLTYFIFLTEKTGENRIKPATFFNPETETDPDQKPTFKQKTDPDPDRSRKVKTAGL
jgi:hypothetical protein